VDITELLRTCIRGSLAHPTRALGLVMVFICFFSVAAEIKLPLSGKEEKMVTLTYSPYL